MMHLIFYRMIQVLRNYQNMFWAIAFPLILATMFRISFGSMTSTEQMEQIPVAVVMETEEETPFLYFLEQLDGETLELLQLEESKAVNALEAGEVNGIFYVSGNPSLMVSGSGIRENILKMLQDLYVKNAALLERVALEHPEGLAEAVKTMTDYQVMTETDSDGASVADTNVTYFFALIAYACLSGAFLGAQTSYDSQANLSALGARRSISPTHKLQLILVDLITLVFIHFANVMVLTVYIHFVLGIAVGTDVGGILLVNLMGSIIGISLGIAIGSLIRASQAVKVGIVVGGTLLLAFLAGLMFGNMKDIIEHACPFLNRINPAAVLSDAYYCLGVYENPARFARCLIILGIMSAGLLLLAFLGIRRERYESL
ncbi:MAG: ABC transporter permease [Candidatus Limivivens sp.]|nr:ABC transporter permease [Candidatus Limivivens sp.]